MYLVHASRDIRRLVKGLQCCSFLLWTCWKSGVVLEINFKFLNFLQMCFCRIVGSSKNTFWSFGKWERELEERPRSYTSSFYVVRFLSRLMSFLECTPRFQTELTLAALPDIPPRNCQNNYKSAEKTSVIGPKGIVNRLGGKKIPFKVLRGLTTSWMLKSLVDSATPYSGYL